MYVCIYIYITEMSYFSQKWVPENETWIEHWKYRFRGKNCSKISFYINKNVETSFPMD